MTPDICCGQLCRVKQRATKIIHVHRIRQENGKILQKLPEENSSGYSLSHYIVYDNSRRKYPQADGIRCHNRFDRIGFFPAYRSKTPLCSKKNYTGNYFEHMQSTHNMKQTNKSKISIRMHFRCNRTPLLDSLGIDWIETRH